MKVTLAGAGAFGAQHLAAIDAIDDVELVAVVDPVVELAERLVEGRDGTVVTPDLDVVLDEPSVEAVILATPTPFHAAQAIACLDAGKHVEVEIPLCDALADGEAVLEAQHRSGKVAMCGHTRRFNPSHRWIRRRIEAGEFHIQHLDVQTLFFRRTNTNALGEPRSWTDHLLWHHAAHTVDLFAHQSGSPIVDAHAMQGPIHPELGISMDMSIQLRNEAGGLCTLALSFNNDGPFGTFFRYIGDSGTYLARDDDLTDGNDEPIDVSDVDVSANGIELQDREFFAAIREAWKPESGVADVLPCYRVLDRIERQLTSS